MSNIHTQIVAIFAAALMTLAIFAGTGSVASHQARAVAANVAADRDTYVAMEVQHVTIVGHRHHA